MRTENIYKKPEGWLIEYPQFSKLADEQMHSFWPWDEPQVEDDVQDLRVNMTESELHGVVTVLKLFTHYEMAAGGEFWADRVMKNFQRPEITRMASLFSAVELNSHAPFYNKINEVLYLDNEDFYSDWKRSDVLKSRMKFIGDIVTHEDDLYALGAFTFIEGAVLYSSFAFLKHFQAQECGKNLIKNICRGINQSVNDENTHAIGGAMLFKTILEERAMTEKAKARLFKSLTDVARKTYEHESEIVEMIFEKGDIAGISKKNLKDFVKHRVNLCLGELGLPPLFANEEQDNFVASWFYTNINSIQFSDFFTGSGSEYHIKWSENKFGSVWG